MKPLSSSVLALAPSMTVAIDTRAKELQAAGQKLDDPLPNYVSKNIITRSHGPNLTVLVEASKEFAARPA